MRQVQMQNGNGMIWTVANTLCCDVCEKWRNCSKKLMTRRKVQVATRLLLLPLQRPPRPNPRQRQPLPQRPIPLRLCLALQQQLLQHGELPQTVGAVHLEARTPRRRSSLAEAHQRSPSLLQRPRPRQQQQRRRLRQKRKRARVHLRLLRSRHAVYVSF